VATRTLSARPSTAPAKAEGAQAAQASAAPVPAPAQQPGYNKRLRTALPLIKHTIRILAVDTDFWFDNHWILDSSLIANDH
jgi:hypothetical protein